MSATVTGDRKDVNQCKVLVLLVHLLLTDIENMDEDKSITIKFEVSAYVYSFALRE